LIDEGDYGFASVVDIEVERLVRSGDPVPGEEGEAGS
jgi:hypothetical protein